MPSSRKWYKRYGRITKATRRAVWRRAEECCESCGLHIPTAVNSGLIRRGEIDHIIPVHMTKEQTDCSLDNLQLLCEPCHQLKNLRVDVRSCRRSLVDPNTGLIDAPPPASLPSRRPEVDN